MYVLVVAISGGDVVATSVVAKSAPSHRARSEGLETYGARAGYYQNNYQRDGKTIWNMTNRGCTWME